MPIFLLKKRFRRLLFKKKSRTSIKRKTHNFKLQKKLEMELTETDTQMVRSYIRTNILSMLSERTNVVEKPKKFFLTQFVEKWEFICFCLLFNVLLFILIWKFKREENEKAENVERKNSESSSNSGKQEQDDNDKSKSLVLREGLELKLQRNILAKYKLDEEAVTNTLLVKRKEFEKRINMCKVKQNELLGKQEQVPILK